MLQEGGSTNFVPKGEFTYERFREVNANIRPLLIGHLFPNQCIVSSIDPGVGGKGSYFVTANHCVDTIKPGEQSLNIISPWSSQLYGLDVDKIERRAPDVAVIWMRHWIPSPNYIKLSNNPLKIGQEVLIAGYADVSKVDTGYESGPGYFKPDYILLTAYGQVISLPESTYHGYFVIVTTDYQPMAPASSGSPVFVVEDNQLVLAGVLRGGPETDDQGNTFMAASPVEPIRDMIAAMNP